MYLKHKIRKNPNKNGFKNEIQIVSNYVEPKILSRGYKWLFILAFSLMVFISTTAFIVNPLYISFRLFTPSLIIELVSEALLIPVLIFMYIMKRQKIRSVSKAEGITHDIILVFTAIAFVSFIAMMFAFVAFSVSYLVLTTRKNVILRSFVVGFLALITAPLSYFIILMSAGYFGQLSKDETTSFLIQNSEKNDSRTIEAKTGNKPNTFNILSWNLGYAATGSEADYFYDEKFNGGFGTYGKAPSRSVVDNHLQGITQFLKTATNGGVINTSRNEKHPFTESEQATVKFGNTPVGSSFTDKGQIHENSINIKTLDFGFLQEVDKPSIRSLYTDQPSIIAKTIGDEYDLEYVRNLKDAVLPVPLLDPGGQVDAGVLTFSRFGVDHSKARRVSLNSAGTGLDGIFNLKRAIGLIDFKIKMPDGSEKILHLANIHASAFPQDFIKRQKEYFRLIQLIEEWKQNGNYFLIGGDWNTDVLDAYFYTQAENKFAGAGQWISNQYMKDELFDYEGADVWNPYLSRKGITEPQPLSVMNIAKFPNEFRHYVRENKLQLGADSTRNNASMRSNGDKWQGPYPMRNGKRIKDNNGDEAKEDWDKTVAKYNSFSFNKATDYVPSVSVIDGFITSSNIKINWVRTIQQGWHKNAFNPDHPYLFADSDHNPVIMNFSFI